MLYMTVGGGEIRVEVLHSIQYHCITVIVTAVLVVLTSSYIIDNLAAKTKDLK